MPEFLTTEQFIARATTIHKSKYCYSKVEYATCRTKVIIVCQEHGEFVQQPYLHLQGQGCKQCGRKSMADSHRYSTIEFIRRATEIHGNRYDYSKVKYVGNHYKIIIGCRIHGDFSQEPVVHLIQAGCPKCSSSKGELKIKAVLDQLQVTYEQQYRIKECRYKRSLPFDFAILNKDRLLGLMEFNGEQHYKTENHWHQSFENIVRNDRIKAEFCRTNNIPLLIVSYNEKKILESISAFVSEVGAKES